MRNSLIIWILIAMVIRTIFWVGGIDYFERSLEAGLAAFSSVILSTFVAALYYFEVED